MNRNQEGNKEHDQQGSLEKNRQSKDTRKQEIDREQVGVQDQKRWNILKSPVGTVEIYPGSSPEDCYQLKKGIYGLYQAARQFWRKFVDTIKKEPFGFTVSPADPGMLFKENYIGICIIIMYVDDMLIIGKKEQIQEFETKIQNEFSVKIQHNLADYLGCEFHMNKEKTKGWLGQPSIIKSLEQKFGEKAMKARLSLTPGTPRFTARRLENHEDKVNTEDHEIYIEVE